MTSVFQKYESRSYPYQYAGTLEIPVIAGGTPSDPNVAEGWLKSKLADKDDLIRDAVAEVMVEMGTDDAELAAEVLSARKHLNGFKRDGKLGLYVEGRQLKACIKEAASVARAADKLPAKWGTTNKGILGYVAEHIFVKEDKLPLGVMQPTGVMQRFIKTFRGTGISMEEYVENAVINFTVETDHKFSYEEWATLWLTAERQGLGASRSQGYGRFEVARWDEVQPVAPKKRVPKAAAA